MTADWTPKNLGIGSILTGLYSNLDRLDEELTVAETRVKHVQTMLRQAQEIAETKRENRTCIRQAIDAVGRIY